MVIAFNNQNAKASEGTIHSAVDSQTPKHNRKVENVNRNPKIRKSTNSESNSPPKKLSIRSKGKNNSNSGPISVSPKENMTPQSIIQNSENVDKNQKKSSHKRKRDKSNQDRKSKDGHSKKKIKSNQRRKQDKDFKSNVDKQKLDSDAKEIQNQDTQAIQDAFQDKKLKSKRNKKEKIKSNIDVSEKEDVAVSPDTRAISDISDEKTKQILKEDVNLTSKDDSKQRSIKVQLKAKRNDQYNHIDNKDKEVADSDQHVQSSNAQKIRNARHEKSPSSPRKRQRQMKSKKDIIPSDAEQNIIVNNNLNVVDDLSTTEVVLNNSIQKKTEMEKAENEALNLKLMSNFTSSSILATNEYKKFGPSNESRFDKYDTRLEKFDALHKLNKRGSSVKRKGKFVPTNNKFSIDQFSIPELSANQQNTTFPPLGVQSLLLPLEPSKDNNRRSRSKSPSHNGKRKRSPSPGKSRQSKRSNSGATIAIKGTKITRKTLRSLMQEQMRQDRLYREQSNYNYTPQQLAAMQHSKNTIHNKLQTHLSQLKPIHLSSQRIKEVSIFGHLDALFGSHVPTPEEVIQYEACIHAIEAVLTAKRIRRINHKYFIDLDKFQSDLRLPGFMSDLTNIGVQVRTCFKNGQKETYTKCLLSEICMYAAQNPNALLILVLKELKPYSSMLFRLKALKVPIILIVPTHLIDLVEYDIMCNTCTYFFDSMDLFQKTPNTLMGYDPHRKTLSPEEFILINDNDNDEVIVIDTDSESEDSEEEIAEKEVQDMIDSDITDSEREEETSDNEPIHSENQNTENMNEAEQVEKD